MAVYYQLPITESSHVLAYNYEDYIDTEIQHSMYPMYLTLVVPPFFIIT